ncbi:hypothetical protein HDU79_003184 [Rhizoclosmatium sp. JEL0117]|nr:hypothetical protein HDU79_003184 [Rhizoclosmatium sp. JEL0117]
MDKQSEGDVGHVVVGSIHTVKVTYSAQLVDELCLVEGDQVEILQTFPDEWAKGKIAVAVARPVVEGEEGHVKGKDRVGEFTESKFTKSICSTFVLK